MDLLEYYEVLVSADCEGRSQKVVATFWLKAEAILFAVSKECSGMSSAMGKEKGWVRRVVVEVFSSNEEFLGFDREAIKNAALAKLTPLEQELLGLTKKV